MLAGEHAQRQAFGFVGDPQRLQRLATFLGPGFCDLSTPPPMPHLFDELLNPFLQPSQLVLVLRGVPLTRRHRRTRARGCSWRVRGWGVVLAFAGEQSCGDQRGDRDLPPGGVDDSTSSNEVVASSPQGAHADTCHLGRLTHREHRHGTPDTPCLIRGYVAGRLRRWCHLVIVTPLHEGDWNPPRNPPFETGSAQVKRSPTVRAEEFSSRVRARS